MSAQSALSGIKVVEIGEGVALGYCGALFAACGANVIKVEAPGKGDAVRRLPPFAPGVAAPEASGMHAFLSAGKSNIAIDLTKPDGAALVLDMIRDADIILDAMGPGMGAAVGLGYDHVKAVAPNVTMVALSWFGDDGTRRDWLGSDAIAQALAGFIYPIGEKDGPPIIPGGYFAQITGGLTAFNAAMTALIGNQAGHDGAYIDLSIQEAQTTYTETAGVRLAYDGPVSIRRSVNIFTPTYPQTIYPASDGWIGVTVLTPQQWRTCCELLDAPELADDPRFLTAETRSVRAHELDEILLPLFAKRPALEWFHAAQTRRVPLALVPTMADLADLDHFQARDVLATYQHPDLGEFTAATIPWKLAATPLHRGGTAPRLGQHTHDVLLELGMDEAKIAAFASQGVISLGGATS